MANGPRLLAPPVALVPRESQEAANVGFWELRPSARMFFIVSIVASVLATPIMLVGQQTHAALPILVALFAGGWLLRTLTLVRVQRFAYSYHGAVCAALTIQGFPDAALAVACGAVASDSWVYRDRLLQSGWRKACSNYAQNSVAIFAAGYVLQLGDGGLLANILAAATWPLVQTMFGALIVGLDLGGPMGPYLVAHFRKRGWYATQVALLGLSLALAWRVQPLLCLLGILQLVAEGQVMRGLMRSGASAESALREAAFEAQRARVDGLTGLFNRAALDERLYDSAEEPRAIVLIDIDHFKLVNDHWGHMVGDQVLRGVADAIRAGLRTDDFCARYGGEEFCVVLSGPQTYSPHDLLDVCERIREAIAGVRVGEAPTVSVTASVGASAWDASEGATGALRRADICLYDAKRAGRDRTQVAA